MFWRLLRLEASKTFRWPLPWITVCAVAVLAATFYGLFFAFRANVGPAANLLYWPGGLVYALETTAGYASWTFYGTYALIIVVGAVTAQEYSWRTLQVWLGRGVPRLALLAAKFLVALITAVLAAFVLLIVVGGLSAVYSLVVQHRIAAGQVHWGALVLGYLRTVYSMLPYAALTLLLVVASRSMAVAVGGALATLAILETALADVLGLLGGTVAQLVHYLPSQLAVTLSAGNVGIEGATPTYTALQPSPLVAAIGITLYTLAFVGVALWVFWRQDLAG
jgi:ABC-type transport system involved in multi-copper enzyme maturation permease subunit